MRRPFLLIVSLLMCAIIHGQNSHMRVEFERTFRIPETSIRALEILPDSSLWFAGSSGKYGKIQNDSLEVFSLSYQGKAPSFRAIASNGSQVYALSIENPALLYLLEDLNNSTLSTPKLVYQEEHSEVFYDSMTFLSSEFGVAMGDPVNGCLSILVTQDGGTNWKRIACKDLPPVYPGEAGFAASDTNIATYEDNIWIVTGGQRSRVWLSEDRGQTWSVVDTPIKQGATMTGIYSVDFYDQNNGIIMGGDWEKKNNKFQTKALTQDGGKSWTLVSGGSEPGYISCVQYIPNTQGKELMAVSSEGIYHSSDGGINWDKLSDKGYYSIRIINTDEAWLSKNEEIVRIRILRDY